MTKSLPHNQKKALVSEPKRRESNFLSQWLEVRENCGK